MSRFARIFFILLVSAAESCSSEQIAQKQVERKDIRQQLASAYEFLCTHLIRVAASNNGRSQYGNRSGLYGLSNRGKETSGCRWGHLGLPQYSERRTFETIVLGEHFKEERPGVRLNEHLEHSDGIMVFQRAYKMGLEGIVSKRLAKQFGVGRGTLQRLDRTGHEKTVRVPCGCRWVAILSSDA